MIEVQGRVLVPVPKEKTIQEDKENYISKIYLGNPQDNIQDYHDEHLLDNSEDNSEDNSQDNPKKMKVERVKKILLTMIKYFSAILKGKKARMLIPVYQDTRIPIFGWK